MFMFPTLTGLNSDPQGHGRRMEELLKAMSKVEPSYTGLISLEKKHDVTVVFLSSQITSYEIISDDSPNSGFPGTLS